MNDPAFMTDAELQDRKSHKRMLHGRCQSPGFVIDLLQNADAKLAEAVASLVCAQYRRDSIRAACADKVVRELERLAETVWQ